jgi:hypothetical protein
VKTHHLKSLTEEPLETVLDRIEEIREGSIPPAVSANGGAYGL